MSKVVIEKCGNEYAIKKITYRKEMVGFLTFERVLDNVYYMNFNSSEPCFVEEIGFSTYTYLYKKSSSNHFLVLTIAEHWGVEKDKTYWELVKLIQDKINSPTFPTDRHGLYAVTFSDFNSRIEALEKSTKKDKK